MWKSAARLPITPEQQETLRRWLGAHKTPQSVVTRCRIVLMAAEGISNHQIAKRLPVSRPTVLLWRQRFATLGPAGLAEICKGRGRPPRIGPEKVEKIVHMTLHTQPKGATHWSCRTMAQHCGLSPATVQRIWGCPRVTTSSAPSVQAVARSAVCRETDRCRWPLPESARQGPSRVCR